MLHAVLLTLFMAVFRKLGFREPTPAEEAQMPGFYVRAERLGRNVVGSVYAIILAMFLVIIIGQWLGYFPPER